MTTPLIPPALPAEAWAGPYPSWRMATRTDEAGFDLRGGRLNITASDLTHPSRILTLHLAEPDARHALAALALHGQPFGFSRADAAFLRAWVRRMLAEGYEDSAETLSSLAARIEALLPPLDAPTPHP